MKKKGFTLIELLAVIVILALIVIITVPKILDVIEKSERTAWGESAGLMAKAAELKYSEGNLTNTESDETYEFENGDFKSGSPTLTFKGDKPYSGKIVQEKGKTTLALISKNKKWCAIKNTGERIAKVYKIGKEITEENCKIGYTGSSDDNKPEEYTCPDISTYPGKDLIAALGEERNYLTDGYNFSIDTTSKEATIIGYTGQTGSDVDLIIPKSITIDGIKYPITTIENASFSGIFKYVAISPNIKTIKFNAFSGTGGFKADKIDFSYAESLKIIEGGAFSGVKVKEDKIVLNKCLKQLETIEHAAFDGTTISNITIQGVPKLTSIGQNLAKVANVSPLKELHILDNPNLKTIAGQTFGANNSVETIEIVNNKNLTTIGHVQGMDNFKSIRLENLPSLTGLVEMNHIKVINDNSSIILKDLPLLKSIPVQAFMVEYNQSKNFTVTLENLNSLETIGDDAFNGLGISTLNMSGLDSLTTINSNAFQNNNITKFDYALPSLTTLDAAFDGNDGLTNVDLSKCPSLTSANFSSSPIVNMNLSGIKSPELFKSLLFSTKYSSTLKNLNIANSGVTSLDLSGYTALENINLNGCSELTSFVLNGNKKITTLDFSKYKNLNKLNTVTLYADTALQNLNLSGLSALTTVQMGNDPYTKLKIPASVTTISAPSTGTISCIEIEGDSTRFDSKFKDIFGVEKSSVASTCTFN